MKLALHKRKEISSATITQALGLILACSGIFALTALGAPPVWWTSRAAVVAPQVTTNSDTGVVTTNYAPNDYAVVTQGQLKQFTARAVDELNADLPGGAGTNLNSLVQGWAQDYATNGYSGAHLKPSDYSAMNVGQIKFIGNQVWAQLIASGFTNAAPSWLAQNTNSDHALANLGQLKEVFNFDPANFANVTLPDAWELQYFGVTGLDPNSSPDGNGLTLLQDYEQGNDPTNYYSQGGHIITPTLTVVSGDAQQGDPGTAAAQPLVLSVTKSDGTPLVNAPVTFTGTSGGLSADPSVSSGTTLTLTSDWSGQVQVYLTHPSASSTTNTITATAGTAQAMASSTSNDVSSSSGSGSDSTNYPPALNYAKLDVSAAVTSASIEQIAFDDTGNAAFSYWQGDTHKVALWQNGAIVSGSPQPTGSTFQSGDPYWDQLYTYSITQAAPFFNPVTAGYLGQSYFSLNVQGELATGPNYFFADPPYNDSYPILCFWAYGQDQTTDTFDISEPVFGDAEDGGVLLADGTFLAEGGGGGPSVGCRKPDGTSSILRNNAGFTAYSSGGCMGVTSGAAYWYTYGSAQYQASTSTGILDLAGNYTAVDSAVSPATVGTIVAINDQKDILVSGIADATTGLTTGAYLLEGVSGSSKQHFLASGSDPGLIPPAWQAQFRNIQPLLISNRNTTATGQQPVYYAAFTAQTLRTPDSTDWESDTFLLEKLADNTFALYEIPQANGLQLKYLNKSGAFSALNGHALVLLPMEIKSKDRMITGSVKLPDSWTGISLLFINNTTGQDLGTYANVVENMAAATPAFKIYANEAAIYSDTEMAQDQSGSLDPMVTSLKVVFYKDDNDPKKLHFATTFDDVGDIRVEIIKNGSVMGYGGTHLTADTNFSSLISDVDNRITTPYPTPIVDPNDPNDPNGAGGNGGSNLLVAQEPGSLSNPGAIDPNKSDPTQLVLPLHTGTALPSASDNDLSLVTLRRPSGLTYNTGTITLTVSSPSSVALFNSDASHVLANYSVNLAAPSGDLAALATGNAQVWVRGVAASTDVTFTLTYTDANGVVQNTDTAHESVSTSSAMIWPGDMRNMPLFCGSSGIRGPPGMALSLMSMKVWSNVAQTAPIPPSKINNGALTTKSLLKVLEQVLLGTDDPVPYFRGVLEGFAGGAWGDLNTLAALSLPGQIYYARDNYARAYSAFEMFGELIGDTSAQRQQLLDNLLISAGLQAGSAYLQWQSLSPDQQHDDVEYCRGYVTGYVIEQVLVLKGIGLAAEAAKTTITAFKAGSETLTAATAIRSDISALAAVAEVVPASDMALAKDAVEKAMAEVSGSTTIGDVIETKLAPLDSSGGQATLTAFSEELAKYTKGTQWSLRGKDAFLHLGDLLTKLGTQATAKGVKGFSRLYGKLLVDGQPDRYLDYVKYFTDGSGNVNAAKLNASLEAAYDDLAVDSPPGSSIYLSGMDTIHGTGYRYVNDLSLVNSGVFSANNGTGWWCTFNLFTDQATARSAMQLPTGSTARYRIEFNLSQVADQIRVPYGKQEEALYLEPAARDYPGNGAGGATQVKIMGSEGITVARIFDLQTGQYVTVP